MATSFSENEEALIVRTCCPATRNLRVAESRPNEMRVHSGERKAVMNVLSAGAFLTDEGAHSHAYTSLSALHSTVTTPDVVRCAGSVLE